MVSLPCWVLTTGEIGMRHQGIGLARALNVEFEEHTVALNPFWHVVPPYWAPAALACKFLESLPSSLPPKIVISCGRRSVPLTISLKKLLKQEVFTIHIQDPKAPPRYFDAVIAPQHDQYQKASNVYQTLLAPHPFTKEQLAQAKREFAPLFESLPSPKVGVLLGGKSRAYAFTTQDAHGIGKVLQNIQSTYNAYLMVTPSRRTPLECIEIIKAALDPTKTYFWNQTGENPYLGILSWADFLYVTCDSVSMISEALQMKRPVYLLPLKGGGGRSRTFLKTITQQGYARWCTQDLLEVWENPSFDELPAIAHHLRQAIEQAGLLLD